MKGNTKQTSDHAQKGPGVGRVVPSCRAESTPPLKVSGGRNPSGQPNPTGMRGKQQEK